jgi:hypothetical protein
MKSKMAQILELDPSLHAWQSRQYPQIDIRRRRRTTRSEHNDPAGTLTILVRSYPHHSGHTHSQIFQS